MAARARRESARRVSDCVTVLLRDQPFFGSLALRLPIRPDAARETLASDGREIRYSPDWVANTDANLVKTAIGRVVLACALKHHTRRGEREPGRWQQASQLVTHGLLRDAGFKLPPDAEGWDGISVEQAYDRLPEPQEGGGQGSDGPPSAGDGGGAGGPQPDADDDDDGDHDDDGSPAAEDGNGPAAASDDSDPQADDDGAAGHGDSADDGDPQPRDDSSGDSDSGTPPSCDPSGTGEVMDAPAGSGDDASPGQAPADVSAEEQAWDEAMHQALNLAKAQGKAPGGRQQQARGGPAQQARGARRPSRTGGATTFGGERAVRYAVRRHRGGSGPGARPPALRPVTRLRSPGARLPGHASRERREAGNRPPRRSRHRARTPGPRCRSGGPACLDATAHRPALAGAGQAARGRTACGTRTCKRRRRAGGGRVVLALEEGRPGGRGSARRRASPWSRLSALGSRLSALGSRLSALGSRLSALGSRLSALGSRLSALGSRLSALGSRLSALGSRLSALGSRLSALGSRLSALGSLISVSPHSSRSGRSATEESSAAFPEFINGIKAVISVSAGTPSCDPTARSIPDLPRTSCKRSMHVSIR